MLFLTFEIETRLLEENAIDDNRNGIVSYKELSAHKHELLQRVEKKIDLSYQNRNLHLSKAKVTFHRYQSQTYMRIEKGFFDANINGLELKYRLFFEKEATHKLLITIAKKKEAIVDKEHPQYLFSSLYMTQFQRFKLFVQEGIYHIVNGIDHLLFIFMLLIAVVVKYAHARDAFKQSLYMLVKIITIFSIAHSLTLFIAGIGWYMPNSQIIESAIAASIFIVAFLNFRHKYEDIRYSIVFLFGLIHGFGFANVLNIAQIQEKSSFLIALLSFNLGVEIGQIGLILAVLPILFFLLQRTYYIKIFDLFSLLTMFVSMVWFLQRSGFLKFF